MRSALFTLLVAAAMTSASASTPPAPAPALVPAPVPAPNFIKPPPGPLSTLAQQDDPGQRIPPPAPLPAAAIQTVALSPAAEQSGQASAQPPSPPEDAGWRGFAPVGVTLALLGAIAVRRQRAKS